MFFRVGVGAQMTGGWFYQFTYPYTFDSKGKSIKGKWVKRKLFLRLRLKQNTPVAGLECFRLNLGGPGRNRTTDTRISMTWCPCSPNP